MGEIERSVIELNTVLLEAFHKLCSNSRILKDTKFRMNDEIRLLRAKTREFSMKLEYKASFQDLKRELREDNGNR